MQLLGDPHGRRAMREATRLRATPDKVLAYMGGPPRIYGSNVMTTDDATAVLEVALHSKGYMERSAGGFITDAVGFEDVGGPAKLSRLPAALLSNLLISPDYPPRASYSPSAAAAGADADAVEEIDWSAAQAADDARDVEELDLSLLQASVGGERAALEALIRRAILSRKLPTLAAQLGLQHVRGVLLYGPPGCGKTLIARTLARALKARPPKIVAAPELLDRWVGEAERRVRTLFYEAEQEWKTKGERSVRFLFIMVL